MTDKEKKSKIADILMDFQEEYSNEVINRPMLASLYAGNILSFIDSLQKEPVSIKPLVDIEIPFGARDSELLEESITIPKGCYATIEGNRVVIRKGEEPVITNVDTEPIGVPASKVELANIPDKDPISDDCGIDLNGQGKIAPNYGVKLAEEPLRCTKSDIDEKLKKRAELLLRHTRILTEMRDKEHVSKDLENACEQLAENARKHKAETSSPFFSQTDYRQGVMDGAKWQKEKDDEEKVLIYKHGFEDCKEQMMTKVIDAHCFGFQGAALFSFRLPSDNYLVGSEVKVIVIKED